MSTKGSEGSERGVMDGATKKQKNYRVLTNVALPRRG